MRQEAPEVQFEHDYRAAIQAAGRPEVDEVRKLVIALLAKEQDEDDKKILDNASLAPLIAFVRNALLLNKDLTWLLGETLLRAHETVEEIDPEMLMREIEKAMEKIAYDVGKKLGEIAIQRKILKVIDQIIATCFELGLTPTKTLTLISSLLQNDQS